MARICPDCSRMHAGPDARCPQHLAAHNDTDNRRRHARQRAHGRDTAAWRRLADSRKALDGYRCTACLGQVCRNERLTVHLDPRLNGRHDLATIDDVRTLGATCHGRIDGARSRQGGDTPQAGASTARLRHLHGRKVEPGGGGATA